MIMCAKHGSNRRPFAARCLIALLLLLLLALTGAGNATQAARFLAPTHQDVDLCNALPQGPDWKPSFLKGNEAWECDALNSNPDTQVEGAGILKVSSQSADDAHGAIQYARDQAPAEVHVEPTDAYGDPGYAIEVTGGAAGTSRYGSYIFFARNCYTVRVDAAFDNRQGLGPPYPLDQSREIAKGIDQQIIKLNLPCSAISITATAEQQSQQPATPTELPTIEQQAQPAPTLTKPPTTRTGGSTPSASTNSGSNTSSNSGSNASNGSGNANPIPFLDGMNIPVVAIVVGGVLLLILSIILVIAFRRKPGQQAQAAQYPPPVYPPQQYPPPMYQSTPPSQYVQGSWPQPGYPVQQVAPRRGSCAPVIILLVLLLLIVGGVAGYFALGGKLPSSIGGTSTSSQPSPPQTFHLMLPVYERDNNFVSDPINGSNGVVRRLTLAALPYSDINHGQTSGITSMEVSIQKGDNPNFSDEATIMSINFASAQGLADSLRADMNARYPGANFRIVVPVKGQSYQIADDQGWKLKITVDDVALDNTAAMTDGSTSPYPVFTTLNLTAIVTPR